MGFGTLGRNVFRGPFEQNSADLFNVWNHPVFDAPAINDIENPSFGQISSTVGTSRLIQFSLRYAF